MAHNVCRKRVGAWMTCEAGAAARRCMTRAAELRLCVWAHCNYDAIGLDSSRMIGVGSFHQRGHRFDGTIVAAPGCTGRTFGQCVDDQTEVLVAALDRLSFED